MNASAFAQVAMADPVDRDQLRLGVERHERPLIADPAASVIFRRMPLLLPDNAQISST